MSIPRAGVLLFALAMLSSVAWGGGSAVKKETAKEHESRASYLGSPDAPVTIVEFTDFECPYCQQMAPVVEQIAKTYPGKVQIIFKHYPLPFHAHSALAHEASLAAGAQGKFWEMARLIFANQKHLKKTDLLRYAGELHLDLAAFQRALDSHQYKPLIDDTLAEAKGLGVSGTPTFFINGEKVVGVESFDAFSAKVDTALGSEDHANRAQQAALDIPVAESPIRGSKESPVTIVEYADFQCPYCANAESAINRVAAEYPGRVKVVFKNFPLSFHEDSLLAHRAAMAAGRQDKFWEMHDLIFARQSAIKRDNLLQMAKELGLDMARFTADMDNEELLAAIRADQSEGAHLGVDGTPTFFVDGNEFVGSINSERFEQIIDGELRAKGIQFTKPPALADGGPSRGAPRAAVTILWYSDVASPLAPKAAQLMDQVLEAYPEKVRVVFKNRPLEFHHDSLLAHQALMAAGAQGKFWSMHDLMLGHQGALTQPDLLTYAGQLGLDAQKFSDDLDRHVYRAQVDADLSEAKQSGVFGVPVFFVNGTRVDGVQTLTAFRAIIDQQLQPSQVAAAR